jgi:SAM-dependent methyltransferase
MPPTTSETTAEALARLYDLDLAEDPGDVELYRALARRTGGPIVELAVGSGRIAIALAADGHRVVGVDIDPAMLARARARAGQGGSAGQGSNAGQRSWADGSPAGGGRLELVEGDLLDAAENDVIAAAGPYRLAILGLNSILLLPSADRQRAALAAMANLLAPGGVAIVDAWQPSPVDLVAFDGRLSLEWLRVDPETGREVTKTVAAWFDSATRLVTLTTLFEEGAPGAAPARWTRADALRHVTVDELASFARAAGLELEQLAGDHELGALEPGSDRVVLVARKT